MLKSQYSSSKLIVILAAIDHHTDCNINAASDFTAQYTTRLDYKYAYVSPRYHQEEAMSLRLSTSSHQLICSTLTHI